MKCITSIEDNSGVPIHYPKRKFHKRNQLFKTLYPEEELSFSEIKETDPADERIIETERIFKEESEKDKVKLDLFKQTHEEEYEEEQERRKLKRDRAAASAIGTITGSAGVNGGPVVLTAAPRVKRIKDNGPPTILAPFFDLANNAPRYSPAAAVVAARPTPRPPSKREKITATIVSLRNELLSHPEGERKLLLEMIHKQLNDNTPVIEEIIQKQVDEIIDPIVVGYIDGDNLDHDPDSN